MNLAKLEGRTLAGRFRLDTILGQGGYGAVFEAEQLSVGRKCAVKVLFPDLCGDDAAIERFRSEARTTSRLTHPNSVIIYDFGRDEELGLLFLAMELLAGRDLRSIIRERGSMSVEQTVHVVGQAAASLQEAHDAGLVHRDIKPHNIMLIERGSDASFVKVIDFGIAKVVRAGLMTVSDVTQTGTIIGTPKYMAPEQIRDTDIDGRTDMYGLAISAYQMLCGRTPFEEGTALEIASRQIAERPEPVRTFRPDLQVSDAFEGVLLRALEKRADDRFETVVEFANALAEAARAPKAVPMPDISAPVVQADATAALTPEALGLPGSDSEEPAQPNALITSAEVERTQPSPSQEATGEEEVANKKTLATVAIPNPARPELSAETVRDGATAEVSTIATDTSTVDVRRPEERPHSNPPSGKPRWAVAVAAVVLAVGVGVGVWAAGLDDEGGADSRPKTRPQAQVVSEEPAFTKGTESDSTATVVGGDRQRVEAPRAEPDAERASGATEVEQVVRREQTEQPQQAEQEQAEQDKAEQDQVEQDQVEQDKRPAPEVAADDGTSQEKQREASRDDSTEEPPSRAPRPTRHTLEVRVIPWGTLYVDGREVGEGTRHVVRVASGRRNLILKQDGEVRARRTVDVSSRSSKIVELVAK